MPNKIHLINIDAIAPAHKILRLLKDALLLDTSKWKKEDAQNAKLRRAMHCGYGKPEKTTASAISKYDDYTSEYIQL